MSQQDKSLARKVTKTVQCNYLLFLPETYAATEEPWPLILFLHGSGERGADLNLVKEHGVAKILESRADFPFIVVSPQSPSEEWWHMEVLVVLLDEIEEKYRVDKNRIYVTGLSMGGFGTWRLAEENPHRFAAIAPICGGGNPFTAQKIKHLPVWTFHGAKDKIVPISRSREMVRALKKLGNPVKFTVYPEAGHDSWTQTYENPDLYAWFLKHRLSSPV